MAPEGGKDEYKKLIEAALFAAGRAMSVEEIAEATGIASSGYIVSALDELAKDYAARGSTAIMLSSIGGKYMLALKEPYASKVKGLAGAPDISRPALRILAYISKNEPIMQSALVGLFGPSVYEHMKELLDKDFVKAERSGRSKRISTTLKFKEYFGV